MNFGLMIQQAVVFFGGGVGLVLLADSCWVEILWGQLAVLCLSNRLPCLVCSFSSLVLVTAASCFLEPVEVLLHVLHDTSCYFLVSPSS